MEYVFVRFTFMAVSLGSFSAVCSITGDKLVEWTSNLSLIYPLSNYNNINDCVCITNISI